MSSSGVAGRSPIPGAELFDGGTSLFGFEDPLFERPGALGISPAFLFAFVPGGFFRGDACGVDGIEDAFPGKLAVLCLAAGVLRGGALTGGAVLDGDGGGNLVDVLTAGAAAPVKGLGEILEAEAELLQPLRTRGLKIDG